MIFLPFEDTQVAASAHQCAGVCHLDFSCFLIGEIEDVHVASRNDRIDVVIFLDSVIDPLGQPDPVILLVPDCLHDANRHTRLAEQFTSQMSEDKKSKTLLTGNTHPIAKISRPLTATVSEGPWLEVMDFQQPQSAAGICSLLLFRVELDHLHRH